MIFHKGPLNKISAILKPLYVAVYGAWVIIIRHIDMLYMDFSTSEISMIKTDSGKITIMIYLYHMYIVQHQTWSRKIVTSIFTWTQKKTCSYSNSDKWIQSSVWLFFIKRRLSQLNVPNVHRQSPMNPLPCRKNLFDIISSTFDG